MSTTDEMFTCPITHDRIKEAVIDREGNTYEKAAIEAWLTTNKTSPLTRNPLFVSHLTPNRALQDMLDGLDVAAVAFVVDAPAVVEGPFTLSATTTTTKNHVVVCVKVSPPQNAKRPHLDVVLTIDNSGSMGVGTTYENDKGISETSDLSVLDVVKHGARTVIEMLLPTDRVAIVKYSSQGTVVCALTYVNVAGKALALAALDAIVTEGATNIWDGLFKSMEQLRTNYDTGRVPCVMLMTDGQPNINPPRGHIPMLTRYFDSYSEFSCVVNTYGFGTNLDSELLDDIAEQMHGSYCYIPDSGFVGTIFVNSIANVLTTAVTNAGINVEFNEDVYELVKDKFDKHLTICSSFAHIKIGNVSGDQARTYIFNLIIKDSASVAEHRPRVTFHGLNRSTKKALLLQTTAQECWLPLEFYRHSLSKAVWCALQGENELLAVLRQRLEEKYPNDAFARALVEDIDGQITLGLSEKYIEKWGKHFLRSLARAHFNQQCLNFKDPGVQFYGGKLFTQLRNDADDKFNTLPVPKPKERPFVIGGAVAPPTMESYNYSGGGCFDGEGLVSMADGLHKQVKDLVKDDIVHTRNGETATVICMLKTKLTKPIKMCAIKSGKRTLLTPYHPVIINGKWEFPIHIAESFDHSLDEIYNAVLDNGHVLVINGVECVTLGHGFTEDVVEHEYFGSRVIVDLKCSEGWAHGLVEIEEDDWTRNQNTGRIDGLMGAFVL